MLSARWASELVRGMPAMEHEDLVAALKQARPEDRNELLCSAIQRLVMLVMGYSMSEAPEVDQGLFELGLDSLLGLELKNHIQTKIRKDFPATAIFDYPTIRRLSEYLLADILGLPISSSAPPELDAQERDLVDEIGRMSEEEVEARLARELSLEAAT
jgi:acyl carrier protein